MKKGVDLLIESECINDDEVLNGLLTKGKKYIATEMLNIGDFRIKSDDNGNSRLYKCKFFKVTKIIKCDYDIFVGSTFH